MSLYTFNPTGAPTTPDPGQGGAAVTGAVSTGHGNTTCSASSGGSQTKTCIWTAFPAAAGQILSATLKADWSENGSLPTGVNQFKAEYSLNNGSTWSALFDHADVVASANGTASASLSVSQDFTQVRVRDKLFVLASGAPDVNSVTGAISSIRLEVEIDEGDILVMQ